MDTPCFLQEVAEHRGIRLQLWLENLDGEGFGNGRIQLLRLVDEMGSISKAAKKMGMSYRGAWGKLKKAEQIAGIPLVASLGSKRDGCRLTDAGRDLVNLFQQWYEDVESFSHQRASELFRTHQSSCAFRGAE